MQTASNTSDGRSSSHLSLRIAFGLALGLTAVTFAAAGAQKFLSSDGWQLWFSRFGYPGWFAFVVGAIELVGAGLLLAPRIASYVSMCLGVVMIGALHAVLTHETDLSWETPLILIALLSVVGAVRWRRRIATSRDD